jgi:hypothetical protein
MGFMIYVILEFVQSAAVFKRDFRPDKKHLWDD